MDYVFFKTLLKQPLQEVVAYLKPQLKVLSYYMQHV